MHLAINEGELCTIAEVAERFGISKNHLTKVAHLCGKAGWIETIRGRAGGLALGKDAKEIKIGEVVRTMEADLALVECFQSETSDCLVAPACRLKGAFGEALEAFISVLDRYTLDQLTTHNGKLEALLRKEAA